MNTFSGIIPKIHEELLPEQCGVVAENLMIESGKIVPEKTVTMSIPDRDYAPSPVHQDQYSRLYIADGTNPMKVSIEKTVGGVTGRTERDVKFPEPNAVALVSSTSTIDALLTGVKCWWNTGYNPNTGVTYPTHQAVPHYLTKTSGPTKSGDNQWSIVFEQSADVVENSSDFGAVTYQEYFRIEFADGRYIDGGLGGTEKTTDLKDSKARKVGTITSDFKVENTGEKPAETAGTFTRAKFRVTIYINREYIDIARDFYYVARYVDDTGAEGVPGVLSAMITRKPDESLNLKLSAIASHPAHITKARIYRSAGEYDESGFFFLSEINAPTTVGVDATFSDAEIDLSEEMPSYGNPPDAMENLVNLSGSFMAANVGTDIYFSDPYLPHQWPWKYAVTVPFPIVAMASRRNYLYVMTTGGLYGFVGDLPEAMSQIAMSFNHPCISKSSVANVDGLILYAADLGIVAIGDNGPAIMSSEFLTVDQYKAMFDETAQAASYNGKYFITTTDEDGKAVCFDLRNKTMVEFPEFDATIDYPDYDRDEMFPSPYGQSFIYRDDPALTARWKSRSFLSDRPISPVAIKIDYRDGEIATIKLHANGEKVYDTVPDGLASGESWKLPILRRERHWQVEISGSAIIENIYLVDSIREV